MTITITGRNLTIENVVAVSREHERVELSKEAVGGIEASAAIVDKLVRNGNRIYGVTTGFGALADTIIPDEKLRQLQNNIIISHSAGVGNPLPIDIVRAAMLLRANTLAAGCSGVRLSTVEMLIGMLNMGVHPIIPEKGSLGASGDLAPLAHMALVAIGKGFAEYKGKTMEGGKALSLAKLKPLKLHAKEGLALVNGTQIMTGIGALALHEIDILVKSADIAAAMTIEALRSGVAPFDREVQLLRPHPGQIECAANIRKLVDGSRLIGSKNNTQDAYSVRCVPQVNGAVKDTLKFCRSIIETEINSVTDNPIILAKSERVVSGGNFHGEYLAFALDFLAIAISELADIAERRIARLIDPKLSGLPAFLIKDAGLNSGFMIPHYTAASLVSENKVLSHPASVDSIPTSANQEDHVSMGSISANKLRNVIFNVTNVIAIECLCSAQALDLLGGKMGNGVKAAHDAVRGKVGFIEKDEELHGRIIECFELVKTGAMLKAVEAKVGALE
jgi:histidine ammonia-lyase